MLARDLEGTLGFTLTAVLLFNGSMIIECASLSWAQGELRLAWGMRDPVATPNVLAGLRELRPSAAVTELSTLGHYPQLEQPEVIARLIEDVSPPLPHPYP